jgi:CRISPR-associated protein Cmr5
MQTIQQHRARYALEWVEAAQFCHRLDLEAFKARAAELPAMIQMNGLGQAAAFYRMKGDKHAHRTLYDILSGWLCRKENEYTPEAGIYDQYDGLIAGITTADQNAYRLAQAEALALMDWVKRFAKAFIADRPAEPTARTEDE